MKVTTDACIQGAWTSVMPHVRKVLDIGTGTGILALMLAQKSQYIFVDAVEYDHDAALQAAANVEASPWQDRIKVIEADIRAFAYTASYELIIVNPPFFIDSLHNDEVRKTTARHDLMLSFAELIQVIKNCLAEDGYASVLLPVAEYAIWNSLARKQGLYEYRRLSVKHTGTAAVKRIVGLFTTKVDYGIVSEETLVIKNDDGSYSAYFNELLSSFYLHL